MQQAKSVTGEIVIPQKVIDSVQGKVKDVSSFKKTVEENADKNTTELIQIILVAAIYLNSSDIHIEPEEDNAKLRLRVDGLLQDVLEFEPKLYKSLLSRIKLLSKLKLNVSDRPQDGRFSILLEKTPIDIRTSNLPAEYGESVVMRILNPKNLIDTSKLGLRPDLEEEFNKQIERPNGMILLTGPTGSGKTTTLYAILKKLNKPEVKIITIEDPIEYHLEGISQTQVDKKKGYTFADGLRSIMRQDPDVVLVGEIRDLETAQIALQASMTGHLVLSTLHTNDAAGTIARLQALGEKPINISPAINMAIAQRLIRKVCSECVKYEKPTPEESQEINRMLKDLPKQVVVPKIDKIARVQGCKACNNTGYKGRIAIFEFFLVDDEMEKFILTSPSIVAMRDLARKKGMLLMRQDGFIKVVEGRTTIEEINRVTAK